MATPDAVVELDGRAASDGPQRIEVREGALMLHLRAFAEPMRVPLTEVACVAPHLTERSQVLSREAVVPLAQLQGGKVRPDLVVLFTRPQRVPVVQVQPGGSLHLNRRQSMSPEGLFIDGMQFTTTGATDPVARLAAAGAPTAPDAGPVIEQVVGAAVGGPTMEAVRGRILARNRVLSAVALIGFALIALAPAVVANESLAGTLQGVGALLFVPTTLWILWILIRRPWKGVRQP